MEVEDGVDTFDTEFEAVIIVEVTGGAVGKEKPPFLCSTAVDFGMVMSFAGKDDVTTTVSVVTDVVILEDGVNEMVGFAKVKELFVELESISWVDVVISATGVGVLSNFTFLFSLSGHSVMVCFSASGAVVPMLDLDVVAIVDFSLPSTKSLSSNSPLRQLNINDNFVFSTGFSFSKFDMLSLDSPVVVCLGLTKTILHLSLSSLSLSSTGGGMYV